jgi:hypothetical protein
VNVSDLSSSLYVAPPTSLQPQSAAAGVSGANDPDHDGDAGRVHHHGGHHHGGGRVGGALMQALQSLGVSMPQANGSATGSSSASNNDGDADDGNGGQSNGAGSIKGDLRSFMHALFQAVRSESTGASNGSADSSSGAGSDPKAGFSNGLATLIAQVGNGSAPSDLQSAFDQLMSDLGRGNTTAAVAGASGTSAAADSAGSAASVSLMQLLTQMQQNLGYGPASASASTGNLVGTSA